MIFSDNSSYLTFGWYAKGNLSVDKSHRIEQKLKMMEEDFSVFIERNLFPTLCQRTLDTFIGIGTTLWFGRLFSGLKS